MNCVAPGGGTGERFGAETGSGTGERFGAETGIKD